MERRKRRRDGHVSVSTNELIIDRKIFLAAVTIDENFKLQFHSVKSLLLSDSIQRLKTNALEPKFRSFAFLFHLFVRRYIVQSYWYRSGNDYHERLIITWTAVTRQILDF